MNKPVTTDQSAALDPVLLEIMRMGLQSIPDQIEADLMRTAFSPLIYEYKDYAVGLVDANGASIALASHGLPGFLTNVLGLAARDGIATYGLDRIQPGDIILTNHAGTSGQHLNNVIMYTPIFGQTGSLLAFMAVNVHWIDIGGTYPGSSLGTNTTEVIQEGLQLRSVKLYRRGEPIEEVYRIIEYNSRQPEALLGDIGAQLAGCLKGKRLFEQLLARHGEALLMRAIKIIWANSEAEARAALGAVPEGVYEASSFMDDDGVERGKRIPIKVKVIIKDGEFIVDFSDCGEQVRGPYNSGFYGGADSSARISFKYLFTPDAPANEGSFAPVRVICPPGKFISASATAPLAKYQTPLSTVIDTIIAALAPALPGRVAAGHHGAVNTYSFSGTHPRTNRYFGYFDTSHGGFGASAHGDGPGPYKTLRHADNKDIPVEVQEARYPVLVESYQWNPDSGGAGRYRGGLGIDKTYRILSPLKMNISFERHYCPPWGLFEGLPGRAPFCEVEKINGERRMVLKESGLALEPGDRIHLHTGGGGGYGPPKQRDEIAVRLDVELGYISRQQAESVYGVTLTNERNEVSPTPETSQLERE